MSLNQLIIMADEHNPKMLGGLGHKYCKTPNLDRLAARGTRFSNAYTTSPICVPARASFATGRLVHEIGYWDNSIAYDGRVEGWGHRLQNAGIPVESIGKLHYRRAEDPLGLDVQHVPMHLAKGVGMVQLSIRNQFPDYELEPRQEADVIVQGVGAGESEYTSYDRRIAEIAVDWLQAARSRTSPWVLFVSFVTPHYPLIAPQEFLDMYPVDELDDPKMCGGVGFDAHPWFRQYWVPDPNGLTGSLGQRRALAAYLALCSFMDAQVGQVLDALASTGLADTTRVMYLSDHGENAGARGFWGKSNHYEEASGIPLILAGPGVPAGAVCDTPVTLADGQPTILQTAGLPYESGRWSSRSLLDIALEPYDPTRIAFSEYHAEGAPSASYMLRRGQYKFIHYVGYAPELFDLDADPEETVDLARNPAYTGVVQEFDTALRGILDPDAVNAQANEDQRKVVDARGGPAAVLANLITEKSYTPVPDGLLEQ